MKRKNKRIKSTASFTISFSHFTPFNSSHFIEWIQDHMLFYIMINQTLNNSTFIYAITHIIRPLNIFMKISHINYGYLAEIFMATLFAYIHLLNIAESFAFFFCRIIFMTQHKCTETITWVGVGDVLLFVYRLFSSFSAVLKNKISLYGVVVCFFLCIIYFGFIIMKVNLLKISRDFYLHLNVFE